jgi:predicted phosphodiesterase
MKKIGLLSDLHLEGSNIDTLNNPGWDILVIAGDLSTDFSLLDTFFSYKVPNDIPIIYVLGNHEYEGRKFNEVVEQYKNVLKPFEHVYLLDNESVVIENIKFIGSTLWSNFELKGIEAKKESMKWAKQNIADFTYIFKKNKDGSGKYHSMTPEEMVEENEKSQKFIEFELKNNLFEGERFVVTHFAPHKGSINPQFIHGDNSYWVNNLEHLMGLSQYWVHGHTHSNFNYEINGTKVICNPRGFSKTFNLDANPQFNRELVLPVYFENELEQQNTKKIKSNKNYLT